MTTPPGGHGRGHGADTPHGGRSHPQEQPRQQPVRRFRRQRPRQPGRLTEQSRQASPRPWPYAVHLVPDRAPYPDRDRRGFVAPLVGTVLGVPLMLVDALFVMFSPMATDSCSAHGCHALYTALVVAPCLLAAAVLALIAAWQLPHRLRLRVLRTVFASAAPLLALAALLLYLHLPAAS